jgi:hypothetical protein
MFQFLSSPTAAMGLRALFSFGAAIAILVVSGRYLFGPRAAKPIPIQNFLAYVAAAYIAIGFACAQTAADRWAVASLWAGAALFTGAILGILFGLPTAAEAANTSNAQTAKVVAVAPGPGQGLVAGGPIDGVPEDAPAVAAVTVPAKNHTLLADTAGFISKFLAGAGVAQFKNILTNFLALSRSIGSFMILPLNSPHATVFGAGLLLYFGLIGFLCGLILPYYFLKNFP